MNQSKWERSNEYGYKSMNIPMNLGVIMLQQSQKLILVTVYVHLCPRKARSTLSWESDEVEVHVQFQMMVVYGIPQHPYVERNWCFLEQQIHNFMYVPTL